MVSAILNRGWPRRVWLLCHFVLAYLFFSMARAGRVAGPSELTTAIECSIRTVPALAVYSLFLYLVAVGSMTVAYSVVMSRKRKRTCVWCCYPLSGEGHCSECAHTQEPDVKRTIARSAFAWVWAIVLTAIAFCLADLPISLDEIHAKSSARDAFQSGQSQFWWRRAFPNGYTRIFFDKNGATDVIEVSF